MPSAQNNQVEPYRADRQRQQRSRPSRGAQVSARRRHRLRLNSAINEYLGEMRARRSVRAADRMGWLLDDFRQSCQRVYLQAITRRDLMGYMADLRERRLPHPPLFNRPPPLPPFPPPSP